MTSQRVERRLAAVLAADVANYSRLMGVDEVGTLDALKARRREVVDPAIAEHKGRIVKTTGDGMLVEFASTVDAVTCAIAIQEKMAERSASGPEPRIRFRIGINVGEIIIDGDDLFGDGVNVAARVENECEPGGVYVSGNAFEQMRGKTKFAFDDLGERTLKNIDRPVRLYAVRGVSSLVMEATEAAMTAPNAGQPLPLPDKPSIAVLPFQNMSGDPEQEYFADGMVDDIITALSRFKSLFVIARNSSFSYKGKSPDIRQVGRELGVTYVLEGSVRKAGSRLRINGQLIDATTGAHLWADRFDGTLEDVFELQDQMTERVVAAIAPRLELQAAIDRSKRKTTGNLGAYDCYLRGRACLQQITKQSLEQAERLLREAFELDPELAPAYGLVLQCHANRRGFGLVSKPAEENAEVARLVRIVLRVGQDDAAALSNTSWAVAYVLRDLPHAQLLVERALVLNPNLAHGWTHSGWINVWSGNPAVALEHLTRAIRHDPLQVDRAASTRSAMAHALFFLSKYDEAMTWAEIILRTNPDAHPGLRIFAASAAFANVTEAAREMANRLHVVDPEFRVSRLASYLGPYQKAEFIEKYAEGLRLAGMPE